MGSENEAPFAFHRGKNKLQSQLRLQWQSRRPCYPDETRGSWEGKNQNLCQELVLVALTGRQTKNMRCLPQRGIKSLFNLQWQWKLQKNARYRTYPPPPWEVIHRLKMVVALNEQEWKKRCSFIEIHLLPNWWNTAINIKTLLTFSNEWSTIHYSN